MFVHGTGDNGDIDALKCTGAGDDYRCMVASAQEYWTQPNVDSQRTRADGTRRPFLVIGCPLGTHAPWTNASPVKTTAGATGPEAGSAECVAAETARFLDGPDGKAKTADDITDVVIVTHSGGSNVVRYLLAQNTSRPTFARVHAATRRVVTIAAPSHGTYLANYMFRTGSLGNVLGKLAGLFGSGIGYDDDGTAFIQTDQMDASNKDPARFVSLAKDVAGIPFFAGGGTNADVTILDSASTCAGSVEARALALLHDAYLAVDDPATYRETDCSDGFISCRSAMAMVNGDASRAVFGRLEDKRIVGKVLRRNHNQSRRDCDATDLDIRGAINGTPTLPKFLKNEIVLGEVLEPEQADVPHALVALALERGGRIPALRMPAVIAALPEAGLRWRHAQGFVRVLGAEDTLPLAEPAGAVVTVNATSAVAGVELARFESAGTEEQLVKSAPAPMHDFFSTRAPEGRAGVSSPLMQVRPHEDRVTVRLAHSASVKLRTTSTSALYAVEAIERASTVRLSARPVASRFFAASDAVFDVALAGGMDGAVLYGTAHGPSGETAPVRVEPQADGRYRARVELPAAGVKHVGVWSVTLEADGRTASGQVFARTLVVPFSYVAPIARIARVDTVPLRRDAQLHSVEVDVAIDAATAGRLGVHAYLVVTRDGRATVLHAQASADVEPGSASLHLVFDNPALVGATHIELRNLALVSHDLASTLDIRP